MALADHVKAVIYGTIATTLSAGVIAVLLWLKGLQLHWALLVTAGFILALAVAAYLVALVIEKLRKPKAEPMNQTASDGALARSNARVSELERTLSNLQEKYDDAEWLRAIADAQKEAIPKYIVVDCWIIEHDLLRDSPFVDFQVRFRSACVYKLSFVGLSGSVRFANQRLSENAIATRNLLDKLGVGEVGWVTLRQPLTQDDAIRILNQPNDFYFDYIHIELQASPGVNETIVVQPRGSVKSNVLRDRYPNLKIEELETTLQGQYDWSKNGTDQLTGSLINVHVKFESPRSQAIEIASFKLDTPNPKRVTSAQTGDIYTRRNKMDSGGDSYGDKLDNLNVPICAEMGVPHEGWLQFVLLGVHPRTIKGTTPTVLIVANSSEKHPLRLAPLHYDD